MMHDFAWTVTQQSEQQCGCGCGLRSWFAPDSPERRYGPKPAIVTPLDYVVPAADTWTGIIAKPKVDGVQV